VDPRSQVDPHGPGRRCTESLVIRSMEVSLARHPRRPGFPRQKTWDSRSNFLVGGHAEHGVSVLVVKGENAVQAGRTSRPMPPQRWCCTPFSSASHHLNVAPARIDVVMSKPAHGMVGALRPPPVAAATMPQRIVMSPPWVEVQPAATSPVIVRWRQQQQRRRRRWRRRRRRRRRR